MAFTPVLKIGHLWKDPPHLGQQLDLTGEAFLRLAKTAPGQITNLVLDPLSKETQFIEDNLAGQIPFRPRIISPSYTPRFISTGTTGKMAWVQIPQQEELAQRQAAHTTVKAQLQALATKTGVSLEGLIGLVGNLGGKDAAAAKEQWAATLSNLSARERDITAGLCLLLAELDAKGTGFLEEVPNLYDTGVSGVRWNFAVPNVEKVLIAAFGLQADQTQIIRFKRMFPLPGQVRPEFAIVIGNGYTQYALVFTADEAIQFRHYRNTSPRERHRLETDLKAVLETGYLTAADLAQIEMWSARIDVIKRDAKATGGKPTGANAQAIENLKKQIAQLRESKSGLTDAMQKRRNEIEAKLYYATVPVGLQEDARSLFNQEVTVTLGFKRKGLISIRIGLGAQPGKEAFYYEIESITKTARPYRILPDGSHILIRSNGGPFGLVYGVADNAALATLSTQPFEIPFDFDPNQWSFTLDAIGLRDEDADGIEGDAGFDTELVKLPRCRIEPRVELVSAGYSNALTTKPTRIRACLDFISEPHVGPDDDPLKGNHDYGAELLRATLTCTADEAPDSSTIIWDSRDKFPIEDVQLNSVGDGAQMHEVFLHDVPRRDIGLPVGLANRYCEFGLIDTRAGATYGQYRPLVRGGTIIDPSRDDIRYFARAGAFDINTRQTSSAHLVVQGVEVRFDRPIQVALIGNNERPNEYLRKLALANGVASEWVQGIATGSLAGLLRIEPPRVGHYPDVKPNIGDSLWTYMQEIVAKHCPLWRLRPDVAQGVVLERIAWRDRRDIHFKTTVAHHERHSIHRTPGGSSGLRIRQDLSEYWTEATFIGAYNAGTGKRHSAYGRVAEAIKPGSAYNIGQPRIYFAAADDSLRSKHQCEMARRQFMLWHGLPPWMVEWISWYDPDVREGDLILVDDLQVVLRRMAFTRFARGAEQKANFTGRLAQDIYVPGHEGEEL